MKDRFFVGYMFGATVFIVATVMDSLGFPKGWPAFFCGVGWAGTCCVVAWRINGKLERGTNNRASQAGG